MIANPYAKKKKLTKQQQQQSNNNDNNGSNNNNNIQHQQKRAPAVTVNRTQHLKTNSTRTTIKQPPSSYNQYNKTSTTTAAAAAAAALPKANTAVQQQQQYATSFTQAFESIEDTEVYKQAWDEVHNNSNSNDDNNKSTAAMIQQQQRAEQRKFEQQQSPIIKDGVITSPNKDNHNSSSNSTAFQTDRDHHVLLTEHTHVLYVSTKQRGNSILNYIRNVPIIYVEKMVPDYIFNNISCALFLSIKYYNLYPEYIYKRIAALKTDFTIRILLVLVDIDDNANVLLQLNKIAITHNFTLILSWSEEEAARYLETYKAYNNKSDASIIQKSKESVNFVDQVTDFITTCKTINKTDAGSVLTQFGSVRAIMNATPDELALISGLGEVKVKRLYDAFHKPFSKNASIKKRKEQQQQKEASAEQKQEEEKLLEQENKEQDK